ncbi:MAG: hypothetical protein AAF962_22200 [Actinomycetota bacterium]
MFVDLPLGHTTGLPGDVDGPRRLLVEGLTAGVAMTAPGSIHDLPYRYIDDDWKRDPLSWSRRQQDEGRSGSSAGDTRTGRRAEPVYQSEADREAAASTDWADQCLSCLGVDQPGS